MVSKRLKVAVVLSFTLSMAVLLAGGWFMKDKVPPYPDQIVSGGETLAVRDDILTGQKGFQKYGLMDMGSIWGHGALRGIDFSAALLHEYGVEMRTVEAQARFGRSYESMDTASRGAVDAVVIEAIKKNTYDASSGTLTLNPAQKTAFKILVDRYAVLLNEGDMSMGIAPGLVADIGEARQMATFFFWSAWAAGTTRPSGETTFTNNWPYDPSVGNGPPAGALAWTFASILAFLCLLGYVMYIVHRYRFFYGTGNAAELGDRLAELPLTPSQLATAKYFFVAVILFFLQTSMGGLLAHYTVHPDTFWGIDKLVQFFNFQWAKTWHLQLAILWIAAVWIATAIFVSPIIGRREPKGQRALVNILFGAILLVTVGSLTGEVLGIKGFFQGKSWFWFGHQGWEYLELGRVWQIALFGGLAFWLFIMIRCYSSIFRDNKWGVAQLFTYSAGAIVLFFGFGLLYSSNTHISIADYWRWYVVHLWVEGMFEFFAAAAFAFLLTTVGLVDEKSALRAAYLTATLAFLGGIIGTGHHYYWFGGPSFWLALGGTFSALETVPLLLLVVRGWFEFKHVQDAGHDFAFKWPLYFLVASSFWNFLGAGVFGFMITTPLVNYFEHATYLTANHGHTALFGTYGMLAISLMLFVLRIMMKKSAWNEGLLKVSFWGLNIGLGAMFLITLLPVGILQVIWVIKHGFWMARSAAFYNQPLVQALGQFRMIPDVIMIGAGVLVLIYIVTTAMFNLRKATIKGGESFPD